jgi:N-acetylglucosaminyldiphosphoundecaprenol N-acetyl-beta-D-mannosaminyltransferase
MKRGELKILDYSYTALAEILIKESETKKILLTYFNFSTYNLIKKDDRLYDVLKDDFHIHCDGVGTYLFSKLFLGYRLSHNITGSDFYPVLIKKIIQQNKKVFLIFSSNTNYTSLRPAIEKYFGDYRENVDFGVFGIAPDGNLQFKINIFKPDVVFLGTGQPFQEYWVSGNKDSINSKLIVCCGSGMEFMLSQKKRAPLWVQKAGFEWMFRFLQEPRRLWRRYIIGIPVFMFNIILIKVKLMLKKEST